MAGNDDMGTQLATALRVRDLHEQVPRQCQEGTAIPGMQWLRIQFLPQKPTAKTAAAKQAVS